MNIQKLILPGLIIAVGLIIYFFYLDKGEQLGSFSSFDPNNSANKEITVQLVKDNRIKQSANGVEFFAVDKDGREVFVTAPADLPENFLNADKITLTGHIHAEYFHAIAVKIE